MTLATLQQANDRYGATLLACAVVVGVLVWAAHRPVRARPVREPRPPIDWSALAWRVRRLIWMPGARPDHDVAAGPWAIRPPPVRRRLADDASRPLQVVGASRPQVAPRRPHSAFYDLYLADRVPSPSTGRFWSQTRADIMGQNRRRNGGRCLLGIVCGGQAQANQLDHCAQAVGCRNDYDRLGRETLADCRPVCDPCHERRTQMQRQGINAWLWQARYARRPY